jgi:hypothetical protein
MKIQQFLTALCLCSIATTKAQTTCTASTVAQLNTCFATTTSPNIISLTSTIALGGTTLTIPNNTFTIYTNGFDITGSSWSWATAGSGSIMNTSTNATSTVIQVGKNGTYKFSDINGAGSLVAAFSTVLSIELTAFMANALPSGNLLTWTTANEVNNKGFQVERLMTNGEWSTLGFVKAQGKAATYDFTDNTPLSTTYYRLRQMDNDGKETLSKVISISLKSKTTLKAYPSVTTGILTVETTQTGAYQVFNLLGQQLLSGKTPPEEIGGLDVSALPIGAYFLRIGEKQVRFMKQ